MGNVNSGTSTGLRVAATVFASRFKLLLLGSLAAFTASANHIAGGYITYECYPNGAYMVSMYLYRDCSGMAAPNNVTLTVRDASGNSLGTFNLTKVQTSTISSVIVHDVCLASPPGLCIHHVKYSGLVALPNGAGALTLAWTGTGRPNNLTNLAASQNATFTATVADTAQYGCNNAPDFPDLPPFFVCVYDSIQINHAATDPDGDSLAYYLCAAKNSPGWPPPDVTHQAPYSTANPMASAPPLSVNPVTGFITGYPTLQGQFVVAVCVDEFRNGVKIGEYRREFQFNVVVCDTVQARIAGTVNDYDTITLCSAMYHQFGNAGEAHTFHWNFGTGNPADTSSASHPTFNFPDTGMYTVMLVTSPHRDCADTAYALVAAYSIQAFMNWTTWPCLGTAIQFVSSSYPTYSTTSWYWDFNGDGSSALPNPTFTWNTLGIKNIMLVADNGFGCVDTVYDYLVMLQLPSLNVSGDQHLCPGDSVQLNAVGSGTISWAPSTGLSDPNVSNPWASPSVTTVYTVTASGTYCQNIVTVTVHVVDPPVVSAGPNQILCNPPVQLNATATDSSGIVSWTWSPASGLSQTNIPDPSANPSGTVTYTVTATNTYGCTGSDSITVSYQGLTVNAGADTIICNGASAQLNATSPDAPTFWSWLPVTGLSDPAIPNPTASPSLTTIYTITVSDTSGCSGSDVVQVTVLGTGLDAGADTVSCGGADIQLTATGATSYLWDPHPSLSCLGCPDPMVISPVSASWYFVTGTDANGCISRDSVYVSIGTFPTINASPDTFVCAGTSVSIQAFGPPLAQYQWTGPPGLSCTNCPQPSATPVFTSTWTVTVTDVNGCQSDTTITVEVKPLPPVTVSPDLFICEGDSAVLSAGGASSYLWQPGSMITSTVTVSPTSTTAFTVIGTDVFGCLNDTTVTVDVLPAPNVSAGPDVNICEGDSTVLNAIGAASYYWQPGGISAPSITVLPTTTTTYTVTGSDPIGCSDSSTVTVFVNPPPNVDAEPDTTICAGQSVTLTASGAIAYIILPPGIGLPPTVSPIVTTTYTIVGTDVNGCEGSDEVTIVVLPLPPVDAGPDQAICEGDSAMLAASGASSYVWNTGDAGSNIAVTPVSTFAYTVTGTDDNGCSNDDMVVVTVNPAPSVDVGEDVSICPGEAAILTATGATLYQWSTGDQTATISVAPVVSTIYSVAGIEPGGCTGSSFVEVIVRSDCWKDPVLVVPTAFTPNDDGLNDMFRVEFWENFTFISMRIYNRWGQMIFETRDAQAGWDGRAYGTKQPVGSYVYVIEGTDVQHNAVITHGNVTILR